MERYDRAHSLHVPWSFISGEDSGMVVRWTTYRFRLINLADGGPVFVSLAAGKQPVTWRAVAKDGAALPASQK